MKKIGLHIFGIILSVCFCVIIWWYLIYIPLHISHEVPQEKSNDQEWVDTVSTGSAIATLLNDAQSAGLIVVGCDSGESGEIPHVHMQMRTKKLSTIVQFFSALVDHLPTVYCTDLSVKKAELLEVDMRFAITNQVMQNPIITPDSFACDPFCDDIIIAQGSCPEFGFSFQVKKKNGQVFIEKI